MPWYRRPFALGLAIAATLSLGVILQIALRPDKKPPTLPHANIADLAPGYFKTIETDSFRYFVIRPLTGEIYAVAAPVEAGAVRMPELYWWKPYMDCKDFRLGAHDGRVTTESRFRCHDANQPDEWAPRWQWDVQGRHIPSDAQKIDNMHRVRIERDDDEIVFVGLAAN